MTDSAPIIAKLDDIDGQFAERAFHGTSFSPEKRGDSRRTEYVESVNGLYAELWPLAKSEEQRSILAEEMERYRQGFLTRMNAFLASHSNVMSPMITGPARFPTARNQKRGQWADNKASELHEWDSKARASIKRKLLDSRPQEEKDGEQWEQVKRDVISSITSGNTLIYSNLAGRLERMAYNGEVALVQRSLEVIRDYNATAARPVFTARHKVWKFEQIAKETAARNEARAGKPRQQLAEANGVELWADYGLDRVQLVFPDKPDYAMREKLKRSGWKWAPSQEAWQRQLTNNGIASGKAIISGLTPPVEQPDGPGR